MTDTKRQLPLIPNQDHLRKQAKSRLTVLRLSAPSTRLAEAQHLIAREYGFASWPDMRAEVIQRQKSTASLYGRFRRQRPAVPGGNEDECEPPIMPHFQVAGASTAILFVIAGIGAWLMVLVGRARTDELYGLRHALALLHRSSDPPRCPSFAGRQRASAQVHAAMEAIVHLQNVSKHYRSARQHVTVLDGFDLQVATGEFLALTGPSGSGKTTILNLLGGLDRPDEGAVTVAGTRLDRLNSGALTQWRASHIGFVFQSHYLMPMLTAAANVELPLMLSCLGRADRRSRVMGALSRVGLADRATHLPSQLSGGQQQRVGIARALIAGAPLLLCDEPTAGLDRQAADSILSLLTNINRGGSTIVMVTHDPQAAAFAGRRLDLAIPVPTP